MGGLLSSFASSVRMAVFATCRNNLTFVKLPLIEVERVIVPRDELTSKAERALFTVALGTVMLIMCLGTLLYR
jgi:hypothetical protein